MAALCVYVIRDCFGSLEARRLAGAVARQFPRLDVQVIDIHEQPEQRPEGLVAVPTYVLDGRQVALGNPYRRELFARLARYLAVAAEEGFDDSP
ncbi:MAG: hypothetical protein U0821_12375 [Chloroflexota bacterium]